MNLYKKLFLSIALPLCFAAGASLFGQDEIIGNDAPENFSWHAPAPAEMSFRFVCLDGATRKYYIQAGDFFAQVDMAGKGLGSIFPHKKTSKIVFYNRLPLNDAQIKGKARFVPAFAVDTGDSSDIIIGIYGVKGKIYAKGVDISLERMPIGSFSVINFNPAPIGFAIAKKPVKLSFFESHVQTFNVGGNRLLGVSFDIFSFKNGSPSLTENKRCNLLNGERMLVLAFSTKEAKMSLGAYGELGRGAEERSGMSSATDIAAGKIGNMLFLSNTGPR